MISRRQLLFSALLSFCYPLADLQYFAVAHEGNNSIYPLTIDLLKEAYWAEMIASKSYDSCSQIALSENYPNIAYLFIALSISEKIHAANYQRLLLSLGAMLKAKEISASISDTRTNLNIAAIKELEKINEFYPEILRKLSSEAHDQAIINCMYSWKSHQQHEEILLKIKKYTETFFGALAEKIEDMKPDYHVCEICGSTVDKKTTIPCEICNYPVSHYRGIIRPALLTN